MNLTDKPKFPEGVRAITIDQMDNLGVEEATGRLYWGAHELQIKKRISLRWYELSLATLAAFSAFGVFAVELFRLCLDLK